MLFFWAPDDARPIGGMKQIYRHAEILQNEGIEARVLHTRVGFECDWFRHSAKIAYLGANLEYHARRSLGIVWPRLDAAPDLDLYAGRKLKLRGNDRSLRTYILSPEDVLVLPEYLGLHIANADIELPLAVFNQNAHGTFRWYGFGERAHETIYSRPNILGAVVVSEHNRRYLEYAFEGLAVRRVVNGVNPALFHPNQPEKARRIAFMPRKRSEHLEQVINMLTLRGALRGWELAPVDQMSESEVAETLRGSMVFISTCHEEGFGLPPLEAAMSGCIVVGYSGYAADEYFDPEMSERVDQDDVLGLAQTLERTLQWIESDPQVAIDRGRAFSERLTARYSLEREKESVLAAWVGLLESA